MSGLTIEDFRVLPPVSCKDVTFNIEPEIKGRVWSHTWTVILILFSISHRHPIILNSTRRIESLQIGLSLIIAALNFALTRT